MYNYSVCIFHNTFTQVLFHHFGWSSPVYKDPRYRRAQKKFDLSVYSSKGSTLQPQRKVHVKALLDKEVMQSERERSEETTEQG